ncbi:M28 family metallopeptidase [Mucilaginibacter sp.]
MKLRLTLLLLFISSFGFSQDSLFARKIVDTLSSAYFWGRGYTKNGVHKAESYLNKQFKSYNLSPMDGKSFLQPFSYSVNTFPGEMEVSINGQKLVSGKDFIVSPESRGINITTQLIQKNSTHFIDTANRVLVILEDKLTWSANQKAADYTIIDILKKSIENPPLTISVNIENKFVKHFNTSNICGIVKGTKYPDSVIVYTAHYDHLGGMGDKTYFPGANDNASGVAQVLSLAKYYSVHPQSYSMAFILFSGEEIGLLGSQYFTENPLIPLKNISFLVNLDLEGTGNEGITVINATIFPDQFNLLKQINNKEKLLPKIVSRGKAANSDHYPFSKNGVNAIYIYTMGGIKAYHDIYDISATLPMDEYSNLFRLIVKFNDALMHEQADH